MIAHENRILWLPGEERSWDDDSGGRSPAGVRISPENATAVTAVFACARILAETVASLPLHILERLDSGGKRQARELPLYRRLHSQPNSWQTSFEWREQSVFHVCLWGDAYSEIRSGSSGAVDQLIPLHPSRMKVETLENGSLRYVYREAKGRQTIYTDEQILHLRGPSDDGVHGMSIVEECREAIALARACEIHGSRFFGAGARPGFILSTDNPLNADARRELADNWNRKHRGPQNAFETAVLTGGLKPYEIPYATNTDSQFLELRQYQLAEIARLFRVPMHLLGVMNGGYGSIEHAGLDFVQHTILPWLRRFESAFTRDLIVDDEKYFVEFDVRGLLRGDSASRSAYYRAMWDIGALSTNDILELENRNPVEGGDVRYRPLNMGTLGQDPTAADAAAQQQPGSGIDGQAVEGATSVEQLAEASLNGTQVAGILQILQQIASGFLSKTAAAALIAAAYPHFKPEQISAMVGGIDETEPPPVPEPEEPATRAWCPTGPGGGRDNSCSSKGGGGGGGGGGDGSYGDYPGDGTPYRNSKENNQLISNLQSNHEVERWNFEQDRREAIKDQNDKQAAEREQFAEDAKERARQLKKSGDEQALQEHKDQTARDRKAMKERHAAERKEINDEFSARKKELEKQFREDKEAYQSLRAGQKKELEELDKAGERAWQRKAKEREEEYEAEVASQTKELHERDKDTIEYLRDGDDDERAEADSLERQRDEDIRDMKESEARERDKDLKKMRDEHDDEHEFKANNLDNKHGEEINKLLRDRIGRYKPRELKEPDRPDEISKLDQQIIDTFGMEYWLKTKRRSRSPLKESRAAPGTVVEGDFVSWDSSGGRARGRIDHVMDYGTLDVPGTDFTIEASEEDPAVLITVYEEVSGGWRATETQVGHKVATLTKIDPLPEPPVEEKAYGKPKRKGRKRGEV